MYIYIYIERERERGRGREREEGPVYQRKERLNNLVADHNLMFKTIHSVIN